MKSSGVSWGMHSGTPSVYSSTLQTFLTSLAVVLPARSGLEGTHLMREGGRGQPETEK